MIDAGLRRGQRAVTEAEKAQRAAERNERNKYTAAKNRVKKDWKVDELEKKLTWSENYIADLKEAFEKKDKKFNRLLERLGPEAVKKFQDTGKHDRELLGRPYEYVKDKNSPEITASTKLVKKMEEEFVERERQRALRLEIQTPTMNDPNSLTEGQQGSGRTPEAGMILDTASVPVEPEAGFSSSQGSAANGTGQSPCAGVRIAPNMASGINAVFAPNFGNGDFNSALTRLSSSVESSFAMGSSSLLSGPTSSCTTTPGAGFESASGKPLTDIFMGVDLQTFDNLDFSTRLIDDGGLPTIPKQPSSPTSLPAWESWGNSTFENSVPMVNASVGYAPVFQMEPMALQGMGSHFAAAPMPMQGMGQQFPVHPAPGCYPANEVQS